MRDQLYLSLDLLGSLPQSVVISVGEQVMSGVVTLVKSYREVIMYVHIRTVIELGLTIRITALKLSGRWFSRSCAWP